MDKCMHCWSRYMDAMLLSRQIPDPAMRKVLAREAYIWLQRYFDAEDRELARRRQMLVRR